MPELKDTLALSGNYDILISALVDCTRAQRRSKLAEAAALHRLEQKLLTIQRASLPDGNSVSPNS